MNEIYFSKRNKLLFKNAPTHSNQQLAALLKCLCDKLFGDCKEFDREVFSCTTSRYLLRQHMKISGALCILLVIFVDFNCFRRNKCTLECRIFNSSPIFEISLCATLLNTLHHVPYNTPEHQRNQLIATAIAWFHLSTATLQQY